MPRPAIPSICRHPHSDRCDHLPLAKMRLRAIMALILIGTATLGQPTGASGSAYRLVGSGPVSVAARSTSTAHQLQFAGGSGAAIGVSASSSTSIVAGPLSAVLPTERIFRANFED